MSVLKAKFQENRFYIFMLVVTLLKLILMGLFSSDYQYKMFQPFVNVFLSGDGRGFVNPYDYYYDNALLNSFPYPPLMLFIETISGGLIRLFGIESLVIRNILFKMPTLIFDVLGMLFLMKLYPDNRKYIGVLYYGSPIVLYAAYMHGQLDIIPTALLIIAMYYLVSQKHGNKIWFIVALAAAISTKLHILAALPIFFMYIQKKYGFRKATILIGTSLIISTLIIAPFWGDGFLYTVLLNEEQTVLTKFFLEYNNVHIYVPIIGVLLIYLQTFNLGRVNRDLVISLCGVVYSLLLMLTSPMPGWFVWVVPFITVLFLEINENKYKNLTIYVGLNFCYLVYYIFLHDAGVIDLYFLDVSLQFLKIDTMFLRNVTFTVLTSLMAYTTYLIYQVGVRSNSLYKRKNMPFTIGIAGDSSTGKSTMIKLIREALGQKNLLYLEGDSDHRWERNEVMWEKYTSLNPKANYLYRQSVDIEKLRTGASITRVDYNHDNGKFTEAFKVRPKPYILMCGLHSLYLPQMRKNLDLKIYMEADEPLRRLWKTRRDIYERSYTKEKVMKQIEMRMEDASKYIMPQREYADLIIHYFDANIEDYLDQNYEPTVSLKIKMPSGVDIEPLVDVLSQSGIDIQYEFSDDIKFQTVIISGDGLTENTLDLDHLANGLIEQLEEISIEPLKSNSNMNCIIELVILILIGYKMRGEIE